MFEIQDLMVMIPLLPLAAALVTAALGKKYFRQAAHWPTIFALAAAAICSVYLLFTVGIEAKRHAESHPNHHGYEVTNTLWQWATIEDAEATPPAAGTLPGAERPEAVDFAIEVVLRADTLSAAMLAMVTFISLLVAIYAVGYMRDDPGYWRFFTYIPLFVFSMTMLLSVSNFLLLYVFWEAVGLCSYLLIGFWFQKPAAAAAGQKAFLVNRVGDFGFALGLFLIWVTYGTLNFHDAGGVSGVLGQSRLALGSAGYVGGGIGLAICLLLFLGACGKSAQFPLHVWLPDAMEGPTPVSALIHAATMVTAGVYMVVRCTPLFHASVEAQCVVACIGAFTALLAGAIALTQTDLKRVLAYSTVSQLGYMFLALGTGSTLGLVAGMFHLLTHAFFKALLFLGAGSVMHAMGGVIDMRFFGGLRRLMPITCITFLLGCLALAGIFPLAGFWSKDMILAAVRERAGHGSPAVHHLFHTLYWVATVTAFMTAFYTFRAFFLTFFGKETVPPEAGHHAHESPVWMTLPLCVLALGAVSVGYVLEWHHLLADYLLLAPSLTVAELNTFGDIGPLHMDIAVKSTVVAVVGVALAAYFYLGESKQIEWLARRMGGLYRASHAKFWFDGIYRVLLVWPLRVLAQLCYLVDRLLIDGLVNFIGWVPAALGSVLRSFQTGMLQFYALAMVLGLLVLIGSLLL